MVSAAACLSEVNDGVAARRSGPSGHPLRSRLQRRALALVCVLSLAFIACKTAPPPPTVLGTLTDFSLTSQAGEAFGSANLRGKVWVATFMFTRCPTVCPRMMRFLQGIQAEARRGEVPLHFVTFSVDTDNDTPPVLRAFAEKYGADLANWTFLTGDAEVVKRTSVDGFKLALEGRADPQATDFGILHGSYLILVDQQLRIRGYYPSNDEDTTRKLLADARAVASER